MTSLKAFIQIRKPTWMLVIPGNLIKLNRNWHLDGTSPRGELCPWEKTVISEKASQSWRTYSIFLTTVYFSHTTHWLESISQVGLMISWIVKEIMCTKRSILVLIMGKIRHSFYLHPDPSFAFCQCSLSFSLDLHASSPLSQKLRQAQRILRGKQSLIIPGVQAFE